MTLFIDDRPVGKGRMDHTVPVRFSGYAGMDIGRDNGGVVDRSYENQKPFTFTGTVKKVVFDIQPHVSAQDELDLHAAAHQGHAAHGLFGLTRPGGTTMHIDDETTDVLIGGYLSTDAAHEDYDAVLNCGARLWGAVVVSKDLDGKLTVEETDHVVAEGAAGLAGSASWSVCSHRHCWQRPRSGRRSVPSAARRSTRSSAPASANRPATRSRSAARA